MVAYSRQQKLFAASLPQICLTISRWRLVELYRKESNAKVKERLLLVIRVVGDGEIPAHVLKGIHRSKPWGSYWLERYSKEGLKGLRNKPKSGRIPQIILEISTRIRKTSFRDFRIKMGQYF